MTITVAAPPAVFSLVAPAPESVLTGNPPSRSLFDTLQFWHPREDVALDENHFDWGVVAPSSSEDREFRIRNVSALYTAADVTVSLEEMGLADPTLSVAAQHYLSLDGRRFTATAAVGSLLPLGISPRIVLRRVTSAAADHGEGDFQLLAHADDWL